MIATYDDLTPAALTPLGFDDPAQACRMLQEMAGHDVPDAAFDAFLRVLIEALAGGADPDRAVTNLGRWAEAVGNRASAYALLAAHPAATRMLVSVFAASQFFADLLIRNPEYLEALTNPAIRDRGRDAAALWADGERRVAIAKTPNAKRDALRRWKAPEILRIGIRDLLGYADMPHTAREISDFADTCVRLALQLCQEERGTSLPFVVIAMGKLGGRELNYASDIDLIFVHGDQANAAEAVKLAEAVRDTLAKVTPSGFVFRVDMRLRPEGRFGPLSRSLESCRAYYESWAEPWERQALMKARAVAGDAALGDAFIAMAQAFVYRPRVDETFIAGIQENKRRLEQKIARTGEAEIHVKEGIGGIRDIEFAVQLMQLVVGGSHPALRTGNTLEALGRLAEADIVTGEERDTLTESYVFLRTVEHRLQIMDELPIRSLPRDPKALRKFGRRLGYADGETFLADYRQHTGRVHVLFRRLFYGEGGKRLPEAAVPPDEITEWALATDDVSAQHSLRAALAQRRFADPDAALALLRRAVTGSEYGGITPEARTGFAALLPALLKAAAATSDPDAALRGLDALAQDVPSRAALYQTLRENQNLLPRFCRLAAEGPFLWQTLLQHQEFVDLLADEEAMDAPAPPLRPEESPAAKDSLQVLASSCLRSRLRTGARDLWHLADTPQIMSEITAAAEAALHAALTIARQETGFTGRFAVIGLGKLGGSELGYASDLDVLYIAEPGGLAAAARLAERLQHLLHGDLARYGFRYELDARLRPDGRQGVLVLDLVSHRKYYTETAATWEKQALLKARPVAGDKEIGEAFAKLVHSVLYAAPVTEAQVAEIWSMKRRIETERWKNPNDLKLAPGGMADIEWTTQLLQLKHGHKRPRLRVPGTLAALRELRDDAYITQADWELLSETYMRLVQWRNHLYLKTGVAADAPPVLPDELRARMQAVRAVCLRLFYGQTQNDIGAVIGDAQNSPLTK